MTNANPPAAIAALSSDLPPVSSGAWMLVLPAGTAHARDGRGPFIAGDIAAMNGIIARTRRRLGATELMVDYDHQAHFGAVKGVGGRAPAAGWVKELRAAPEGIEARIEWTDAARAAIAAGEYRYLSPLFTTDARDRVDTLLNIALVNMPALDLKAVAARASQENVMKKFAEAAGLAADAGEEAILARITALAAATTTIAAALKLAPEATPETVATAVTALAAEDKGLSTVALAAGLDKAAGVETIAAAVRTALAGADGQAVTALKAELADVAGRLKALQDEGARAKATALVDAAIREGRVAVKPLRDHYIARAMTDPDGVAREIAAMPTLGPSGALVTPPSADGAVALSAEQAEAARFLGLSAEDYAKTLKDDQETRR